MNPNTVRWVGSGSSNPQGMHFFAKIQSKNLWFTGKKAAGVQKAQALSEHRACRGQPIPSWGNWGNCRETECLTEIQSTPRRACEEGLCILET